MILKSISPSKLNQYDECPSCFFLSMTRGKFVPNAAMLWGSRMHKAIENYHKLGYEEADEDLQKYLDEYMAEYDQDFDVCETFWDVPLLDTGIPLKLKIDLIKDNILIDHKTTSRLFTQEQIDLQKQVTAYSWAWSQMYDEPENSIRFNVFLTNPKPDQKLMHIMETYRTAQHHEEWEEWVREIIDNIEHDQFDPSPNAIRHNYADCPAYVERESATI